MRHVALLLCLSALAWAQGPAQATRLANRHRPSAVGLVAWYDFVQGADAAVLYDKSGNGFNMALNGWAGGDTKWTSEGLYFDAAKSQYCTIADQAALSITGDVWIEAVFKTDLTAHRTLIDKGNFNGEYTVYLRSTGEAQAFRANTSKSLAMGLTTNAWTHLSTKVSSTVLSVAKNGWGFSSLGEVLPVPVDGAGAVRIGSRAGANYLLGTISELRIYNRVPVGVEHARNSYEYDRRAMANRGVTLTRHATPTPFISLTVDDGGTSSSALNDWAPLFASKSVPGTSWIISASLTAENVQGWLDLEASGWEIGSHTQNHVDLTTVDAATAEAELANSKTQLTGWGFTVNNVAYPWGTNNATTRALAMKYYRSGRQNGAPGPPNYDPLAIDKLFAISGDDAGSSLADMKAAADLAARNNGWLIVMLHDATPTSLTKIGAFIDYAKGLGIPFGTVNRALDLWIGR